MELKNVGGYIIIDFGKRLRAIDHNTIGVPPHLLKE